MRKCTDEVRVSAALQDATKRLAAAGVENAAREAAWLLSFAVGVPVGDVYLRGESPLTPAASQRLAEALTRRCRREPLQYILGTQEFMGLVFQVTAAVLIPRPETEVLVRQGLAKLRRAFPAEELMLADIGTGSGCIAVSLAHVDGHCQVVATDLSADALTVARANAVAHGVADRIQFHQGNGLQPLLAAGHQQSFHALFSNPPYISSSEVQSLEPELREYEPLLALTPGEDGLAFLRTLVSAPPDLLRDGGLLAVEVGVGQAAAVGNFMHAWASPVEVWPDPWGIQRVVAGWKVAR